MSGRSSRECIFRCTKNIKSVCYSIVYQRYYFIFLKEKTFKKTYILLCSCTMNLSKAFDCVLYGHLIAKMHAYGLNTNACEFMSSYLSDRYQRVKISNVKSSWMPLQKGIPQGSSLGPFRFNIFMNDIFYSIELCDLVNYADDNTLSIIASTIEVVLTTLKQDTENAMKWFIINFMQVNPSKFQCMFLKPLTNKEEMPKFIEVNGTKISM